MERKLTAILSADVKGYSRLMGEDEEATIRTLTAYRTVMTTLITQYHGRVVDAPGDNLLAEFVSAVGAVQCAVEVQRELKTRNAALSPERRMEFRIGLNVGDVIAEGERIYGDGVNIAARVEGLAEPGGICISGTVHDQVKNKLALGYEYLGEQAVKNITEPVRVFRILLEPDAASSDNQPVLRQAQHERTPHPVTLSLSKGDQQTRRAGTAVRTWALVVMVGLVLIGGTTVAVRSLFFPIPSTQPLTPSPQPALPLPDKPSIAVLPFVNISEDPGQEYFSDGITEELITGLSRLSGLFVIARTSVFTYKGKAVKVEEVRQELGVQYVLEGSVRKSDSQLRITAQLIDATTGYHLWTERYDRPLKDIFALQDEIVQKIVTTLKLQLTVREQGTLVRKTTDNLEAYDTYLRGLESSNRSTKEANAQARQLFEKAIALDPQYAEAYARLSRTFSREWVYQWSQDPQTLEHALVLAQKAVALDDSSPVAYEELSYAYLYKRQHVQALAAAQRVVALAPNDAEGFAMWGLILNFAGRPEEAIGLIKKAMHLNPQYPYNYLSRLGMAYCLVGRYEEAVATLQGVTIRNPNFSSSHLHLLVSYSELGRDAEARAELTELRRLNPNFSLKGLRRVMPFKDPAELERYLTALRKAGLQ